MYIKRIHIEEGFLDGLDVNLVAGLNVVIGARGTGKTSLIEMTRFCLDVDSYGTDDQLHSMKHAKAVLGSGQVTVTLSDGKTDVSVSRTAQDEKPRATGAYSKPIVFSQTEIETVGLHAKGRLNLVDGFINFDDGLMAEESETKAIIRAISAQIKDIRKDIVELRQRSAGTIEVEAELAKLVPQESDLGKLSENANVKKTQLDLLSQKWTENSLSESAVKRFSEQHIAWIQQLKQSISYAPNMEAWPESAGEDKLKKLRADVNKTKSELIAAVEKLSQVCTQATSIQTVLEAESVKIDSDGRALRQEIESIQAGAGAIVRKGQQLREKQAQLASLAGLINQKQADLDNLIAKRNDAFDKLDNLAETRYSYRLDVVEKLNQSLGPRIRVDLTHLGYFEDFAATIADSLRGSGMRYNDLAPLVASSISPRELIEAIDSYDVELLAEVTGVSKERSGRILSQLYDTDLGGLGTVTIRDTVDLKLLDGVEYKDISALSTGQRCTVILPLVLRHTNRIIIVDQPEDHIDNAFIADTLIQAVLARDSESQILFSTHNANIPVLGDADFVLHMGSDGKRGFALDAGSLESLSVVDAISTVMEGGAKAFQKRAQFYAHYEKS